MLLERAQERIRQKKKQAKDKAGFHIHFSCYVVVNIGLFIFFWMSAKPGDSIIAIMLGPLFDWGIGIVAHFVSVFTGANEQ